MEENSLLEGYFRVPKKYANAPTTTGLPSPDDDFLALLSVKVSIFQ